MSGLGSIQFQLTSWIEINWSQPAQCSRSVAVSFVSLAWNNSSCLVSWPDPPEKPENLSCMAVQSDRQISSNVTCTWQPGKMDEKISTTFTLFGSVMWVLHVCYVVLPGWSHWDKQIYFTTKYYSLKTYIYTLSRHEALRRCGASRVNTLTFIVQQSLLWTHSETSSCNCMSFCSSFQVDGAENWSALKKKVRALGTVNKVRSCERSQNLSAGQCRYSGKMRAVSVWPYEWKRTNDLVYEEPRKASQVISRLQWWVRKLNGVRYMIDINI